MTKEIVGKIKGEVKRRGKRINNKAENVSRETFIIDRKVKGQVASK